MVDKRLFSFEDLAVLRDYYRISSSVILSAPELHETPREHRPRHICLYESMRKLGVQVRVVSFLRCQVRITLHSWKIIQAISWFYDFWVGGVVTVLTGSFFARLASKRDSWGVHGWWEEILLEPVSASVAGLAASQRLALLYLRALVPSLSEVERKHGKECIRKKACSSIEGELVRERGTNLQAATAPGMAPVATSEALAELAHEGMIGLTSAGPLEGFSVAIDRSSFVDPDSSSEGFSELRHLEGIPQVINLEEEEDEDVSLPREQVVLLKSREAKLLSEYETAQSVAVRFREELEASQAEVTRLQALLREGDVRSLVVAEYLRSDVHRRGE
ncbi:hypothetical protein ACLOJK_036962 [Asimina triloba]